MPDYFVQNTLTDTAGAPHGINNPLSTVLGLGEPTGLTRLVASSGNVANASAAATLAAAASQTTYTTGFDITGTGATVALPVVVTIAGLAGGTISFIHAAVAGVLAANPVLSIRFPRPLAASAVNTAIVITCPALGAGSANNIVTAYGARA